MMLMTLFFLVCLSTTSFQASLINLKADADTVGIKACKDADLLSCVVAEVDLKILGTENFDLPGCPDLKKKNDIQEQMERSGMEDQARSFALENALGCEAVFSSRGGKVFGNVGLPDGRDFVLEPCSNFKGCHVWKEEDAANFKENEAIDPEISARSIFTDRDANALRQQGIDDKTTIVNYTIKYYYTIEFAAATDDIPLYFDQVVAETNQGYINSKIPIRARILCLEALDLHDIYEGGKMLKTFRDFKGSYKTLRGGADAAALLLLKFKYCGIGYLNTWKSGMTVTAQTKGCALGYYTMGHELGHNFGATHDREHSSKGAYPYGFGAYIGPAYMGGRGYRTIMAYGKAGHHKKANYYSAPDVKFMNHTTGSEENNNARVIRENRFGIAAIGDDVGDCDETDQP